MKASKAACLSSKCRGRHLYGEFYWTTTTVLRPFRLFFFGIISVRLKHQMQVNFLELNSGEPTSEPRVRRRKKNSTYFVYLLHKTSREEISRFNFTFLVAFTVVVTETLFRFYWGRLGRVEISTLGVGVRAKQTPPPPSPHFPLTRPNTNPAPQMELNFWLSPSAKQRLE